MTLDFLYFLLLWNFYLKWWTVVSWPTRIKVKHTNNTFSSNINTHSQLSVYPAKGKGKVKNVFSSHNTTFYSIRCFTLLLSLLGFRYCSRGKYSNEMKWKPLDVLLSFLFMWIRLSFFLYLLCFEIMYMNKG